MKSSILLAALAVTAVSCGDPTTAPLNVEPMGEEVRSAPFAATETLAPDATPEGSSPGPPVSATSGAVADSTGCVGSNHDDAPLSSYESEEVTASFEPLGNDDYALIISTAPGTRFAAGCVPSASVATGLELGISYAHVVPLRDAVLVTLVVPDDREFDAGDALSPTEGPSTGSAGYRVETFVASDKMTRATSGEIVDSRDQLAWIVVQARLDYTETFAALGPDLLS